MLWNAFKIAFAMYSKVPMPRTDWNERNMRYSLCFFPLVGALIGGLMIGAAKLLELARAGSVLTGAVLFLIPVAVTGGIHLDGFLDTCDAVGSHRSREEKLEILKDSRCGAFSVIGACCAFALGVGIYSCFSFRRALIIAPAFVLSRALSGIAVVSFPNARGSGLAKTFSDAADRARVRIVLIVLAALACAGILLIDLTSGALLIGASLLTFLWYYLFSRRVFGGITGDLAGYFLTVCELVMAAAVWLGGVLWN